MKPGLRQAINNFCRECIFDKTFEGGGSWRQQITDCTAVECPLYEVRPLTAALAAAKAKPQTDKQKAALAKAREASRK